MLLIKDNIEVQRFELLEEKFSILISGIKAWLTGSESQGESARYFLYVKGEVTPISGAEIYQSFHLQVIVSDSNGSVVGTQMSTYFKEDFFGLDVIDNIMELSSPDIQTIKIFPKK